jgi:hypothetical protein
MAGKDAHGDRPATATKYSLPLWNPLLFSCHPETKNT